MAEDQIDSSLCEREQGDNHFCFGCNASSRRCRKCQKAKGIANPILGLCPGCAEKNEFDLEDAPPVSLEDFAGRVHAASQVVVPSKVVTMLQHVYRKGSLTAPMAGEETARIISVTAAFALLCEHAQTIPAGLRIVKAPLRILLARANVPFWSGEKILTKLKRKDLLVGDGLWEAVAIVPAKDREEEAAKIAIGDDIGWQDEEVKKPLFFSEVESAETTSSILPETLEDPEQIKRARRRKICLSTKEEAEVVDMSCALANAIDTIRKALEACPTFKPWVKTPTPRRTTKKSKEPKAQQKTETRTGDFTKEFLETRKASIARIMAAKRTQSKQGGETI